jgi:coronin-1B/1C/6
MPKRGVDVMACEVARGVRLTAKTVEYVSFKVPRKAGNFQVDLFPPCRSTEPAIKFEEYWSGVDKEPLRQEMKPESQHTDHAAQVQRRSTFMAKLGDKSNASGSAQQQNPVALINQQNVIEELKQEIEVLTQKCETLSEKSNQ